MNIEQQAPKYALSLDLRHLNPPNDIRDAGKPQKTGFTEPPTRQLRDITSICIQERLWGMRADLRNGVTRIDSINIHINTAIKMLESIQIRRPAIHH